MKKLSLSVLLIFIFLVNSYAQILKVSDNHRYLVKKDNSPFLWLGDTAWELFHKLNREEATEYLENRAKKGFSVIQAVVLAEIEGLRSPNPYGEVPFKDLDPTQPNEAYFKHVDFIVNKAQELGLVIGMLPTWGDKIYSENPGAGPIVFNKENARVYGKFLGKRYKDKSIVWILGGDRNIANNEVLDIWRAMADGLKEGDGGKHLITFHPRGGTSSSKMLHNEEWLDFNMYQSGHHQRFINVYDYAKNDWEQQPVKLYVDGEPAYEDIAVKFWEYVDFSKPSKKRVPEGVLNNDGTIRDKSHFKDGFFTDYDIRVHAYWNLLSGACGYTYGNNAVWQMFKKGGEFAIPCLFDWQESLDRPGAFDIQNVRKILEPVFYKLLPDNSIISGQNPGGQNHICAAASSDFSIALIYLSTGQPVKTEMGKFQNRVKASWFNPRNGFKNKIGVFRNSGIFEFTPPSSGIGDDWLLVLETKQ
ncbi:MAG: glycoside hydrolase family 140 protein [Bacteroidales bacterium]|nr:glycoside hydrolase family 140 protein [Bacteroidales bacterium]MBN2773389.1 glycoside hydrolase family 140 protein [Prolixibacteraceae bacterium]